MEDIELLIQQTDAIWALVNVVFSSHLSLENCYIKTELSVQFTTHLQRSKWFGPKAQAATVALCRNSSNSEDWPHRRFSLGAWPLGPAFLVLLCWTPGAVSALPLPFSESVCCSSGRVLLTSVFQLCCSCSHIFHLRFFFPQLPSRTHAKDILPSCFKIQ